MNLIVDIGNTRTKIAFFEKNALVEKAFTNTPSLGWLIQNMGSRQIDGAILSATGLDTEGVETFLTNQFRFVKLDHMTPLSIKNNYATPATLGKDRLAAVAAANFMFPNQNCLVIDAGTCLTYNFIDANSVFLGGNISPGLTMRLKAMHHFTAKLPLVELNTDLSSQRHEDGSNAWQMFGNSTETALRGGAQTGVLAEIDGFVRFLKQKYKPLTVILTGGDGEFIYKNERFRRLHFEPNLVLKGLNRILNFNLSFE